LQAAVQPGDTIADMVSRLADLPLNFEPGERWEYGPGTDVVGRLVEVMSGQPLDEFLRQRIFGPLDMPDTHFYLPESKLNRFSPQYTPAEGGGLAVADPADATSRWVAEPHVYFSGAGNPGLVSTARDYFRFQQMMLAGGELDGVRILGRKTIELMTANHTGDLPLWLAGPGNGFGLGYAVINDLGQSGFPKSEGTFWWGGGSGPVFWVDPAEELIGILMVQIRPFDRINVRDDMVTTTYQAVVD
jgi:CubicO group peptidase (beta-lactamase class C family)